MSSSTSTLDLISSSQASKEVTANALFDAMSVSSLFGRRASTTAALTWGYYGGVVVVAGTPTVVANGTLALTASATNYIEYNPASGALVKNTTGWSAASLGYARVYAIVCGASSVTSYTDWRFQGIGAPIAQFPMQYAGTWDASTNTPTLASGTGVKGNVYVVSVAGTTDLDGHNVWTVNDQAIFNGTTWDIVQGGVTSAEILAALGYTPENAASKDVSGGYVGKTLEKINFWNAARTFMSFFTNAATAVRTWTFPDKDGTVAMTNDKLSAFAETTSEELAGVLSDVTGTGGGFVRDTGATVSGMLSEATLADGTNSLALADAQYVNSQINLHTDQKQTAMGIDLTSSSTVGAFSAADNDNLDVGTYNFTLAWTGSLPDWTPSATVILLRKGGTGYEFQVLATGALRVVLNGVNYTSTVATGLPEGGTATIAAIVTRESASATGSIVFKVGEYTLGDPVEIAAGAPATLDNANILYVGGAAAVRYASRNHAVRIFNRALTDSQWALFIRTGVAADDIGSASNIALYSSDFSAGVDSFTVAAGCTVDGNIDAIGGLDDWLRMTVDSATSTHAMSRAISGLTSGTVRARLVLTYYIPSGQTLDGIAVRSYGGAGVTGATATMTTKDAATTVIYEIANTSVLTGLSIYGIDSGGSTTFLGNGTDVAYIRAMLIYKTGAIANYESSGIQPNQWHDSANDNHMAFPTSGVSLSQWKETGQWNSVANITADTTFSLPAGWSLESVLCEETAGNAVDVRLGTTAGGTDIFAATTVPASSFKPIQAPYAFSRTADKTLYFSSAAWSSASLKVTLYLRRIS